MTTVRVYTAESTLLGESQSLPTQALRVNGTYLLGCGSSGQVQLGPGEDVLSLPETGGVLTLRDEAVQQIVTQLRLPPHILVLPVVR